jgi:DNA-binding PadR family transcriptional regulator
LLHRLERFGQIEGRWGASETGRRRKYYRITTEGREQLATQRRQWQVVQETLRGVWQAASEGTARTPLLQGG